MTREIYTGMQLQNIEEAIEYGKRALDTARGLQMNTGMKKDNDPVNSFSEDTLKYFDANEAFKQVECLSLQFRELKSRLIEIKIQNDRLLLDGGFIPSIDHDIADVFLRNVLCRMNPIDPKLPEAVKDVIETLENIKESLQNSK